MARVQSGWGKGTVSVGEGTGWMEAVQRGQGARRPVRGDGELSRGRLVAPGPGVGSGQWAVGRAQRPGEAGPACGAGLAEGLVQCPDCSHFQRWREKACPGREGERGEWTVAWESGGEEGGDLF